MIPVVSTHAVFRKADGELEYLAPAQLTPATDDPELASVELPADYADLSYLWNPAVRAFEPDLDALRAAMAARIDAEAEQVRQLFLTPGSGQAMTYAKKEWEARAWAVDNATPTPFLSAEAPARGMTVAVLAAEVLALSDAWVAVGSAIEGVRMGAKTAVAAAPTLGGIIAAATVDWASFDALT